MVSDGSGFLGHHIVQLLAEKGRDTFVPRSDISGPPMIAARLPPYGLEKTAVWHAANKATADLQL